jgi:thymidylate kinase
VLITQAVEIARGMGSSGSMARRRIPPRPLLIAAEGLDGAGKTVQLELLARWLERRGRSVVVEPWHPSPSVERAAASPRLRPILTPRVAALLAAADAAHRLELEVRRPLAKGSVVLADRYAWTAIAREIGRGLEPEWIAALYRFAPRPDLILFFEQPVEEALAAALARRESSTRASAISAAFEPFLRRMVAAFEALIEGAEPDRSAPFGPWPAPVLRVRRDPDADALAHRIRAAVRQLFGAELAA